MLPMRAPADVPITPRTRSSGTASRAARKPQCWANARKPLDRTMSSPSSCPAWGEKCAGLSQSQFLWDAWPDATCPAQRLHMSTRSANHLLVHGALHIETVKERGPGGANAELALATALVRVGSRGSCSCGASSPSSLSGQHHVPFVGADTESSLESESGSCHWQREKKEGGFVRLETARD